jgi:transcriptional regulator NrdR family protein
VLSHLKEINEVAYVRFASVYKEFSDASDFEKEAAEFN